MHRSSTPGDNEEKNGILPLLCSCSKQHRILLRQTWTRTSTRCLARLGTTGDDTGYGGNKSHSRVLLNVEESQGTVEGRSGRGIARRRDTTSCSSHIMVCKMLHRSPSCASHGGVGSTGEGRAVRDPIRSAAGWATGACRSGQGRRLDRFGRACVHKRPLDFACYEACTGVCCG